MRNLSRATIVLAFLFLASSAKAANPLDITINEISWMGTETSYANEWIEFYNNTNFSISLDGWKLKAADGSPESNLRGTVPAKSFYLLERTDDTTVPDISADLIYTGALGNQGENLELYDTFGNLIDSLSCSSGWFAGDNSTKQTMEKINSNLPGNNSDNWATSQNPGGTPKAKNSVAEPLPKEPIIEPEPEPEPQLHPEPGPEPGLEPREDDVVDAKHQQLSEIYPSGIIINEILPSPEGPDEEEEWIEIFNQNDFEVNLSEWKVQDTAGKTTAYTFPEGTKISAREFLVLSRPKTKITLNNDGDGLNFIQPNGNMTDRMLYEKAPRGQSYNRVDSKWDWSTILTPGAINIIPAPGEKKVKPEKVETEPSEVEEPKVKKGLAAIGEQIPKEGPSFPALLIALSLAIFSGIIILILKKKVKNLDLSKN